MVSITCLFSTTYKGRSRCVCIRTQTRFQFWFLVCGFFPLTDFLLRFTISAGNTTMNQYILRHVYDTAEPQSYHESSPELHLWVLETVLGVDPLDNIPAVDHIYGCYQQFKRFTPTGRDHFYYINKWNSARSDLVAELIPPPTTPVGAQYLSIQPTSDVSYWLCRTVYRLTDQELSIISGVPPTELDSPGNRLVPILRYLMKASQPLAIPHPTVHAFHRARYLMLRYYLDYHYHRI